MAARRGGERPVSGLVIVQEGGESLPAPPGSPSTPPRGAPMPLPPTTVRCRRCSSATPLPGPSDSPQTRPNAPDTASAWSTSTPASRCPGPACLPTATPAAPVWSSTRTTATCSASPSSAPAVEELIHSATIARGRPGPDQPALARRPLLPLHQRSLASPPRGLPGLSQALAIAPSRAAVGCLSRTGRGVCPRSTVMPPRARCARAFGLASLTM